MPLLDMCRRVLAETGFPSPSSIASSSDGTAQQIFAIANTELRALSEEHNWPHLSTEHQFNTVIGQGVYPLPADMRVLEQQSLYDATEYYHLKGSVNIHEWNLRRYGMLGNLSQTNYRVEYPLGVPVLDLAPRPTSVRAFVLLYQTKEYARTTLGASSPMYVSDTDVSKIPETYVEMGVKWRFRRAKGLDFSAELAEYNATIKTQFSKYSAQAEIPIGGRRPADLPTGYVRENGFGS